MATAPPLLSIEQYLHTSYKPDVHFVDGDIEERNVGERTHSFIQAFLVQLFSRNLDEWSAEAYIEQRIRVNSSRVRVCDVTIFAVDAPWEEVAVTPPLACIEVMSPEDRLSRAEQVLADYFGMGVTNVWLIDPYERTAWLFGPNGMKRITSNMLEAINAPIRVDLSELFATLDRKMAGKRGL